MANKRQHEDLSIVRAREKQAEDQVATLRGQQHEQDRIITELCEALAAREATLSDAEARATQAQARAALLEADLIAARSELSALRAEEARLRVALAEARTELTVVQRERGVPRKGWRGVRSRPWLTIAPSPTVISCGLRPGDGAVKASPPPPPASRSLIVVVVEIAYRDKRIRA